MKFLGLKSAIVLGAASALVIIPTVLIIAGRPGKPTGKASHAVAGGAVAQASDFDFKREHPAWFSPGASPTSTPASSASGSPKPSTTTSATPAAASVQSGSPRPTAAATPRPPAPTGVPAFSHVFVIVMENHEYGSIIGSSAAPYINSLANNYGLATNYYGASHPSLPNYLALTAGSTFGITSDCTTCYVNSTNIADQVEASGRSWKAYMEDMPSPCYLGASYNNYAMKHNPFVYFDDIRNNPTRCAAHVVPFSTFSGDMSSGNVPNFVWITPNLCNDMHDCSVSTGDAWLRSVVPTITASSAFRNGGALFITWDEGSTNAGCCGDAYGGHVATLVISPRAIAGYRSTVAEDHYGLLRTIEDAFRLSHLNAAASSANVPLREYFR
jgi:acid phosphatase